MKAKIVMAVFALFMFAGATVLAAALETKETTHKKTQTLKGCLQKGDNANEFNLTTAKGGTWEIKSDGVDLASHVGHMLKVTGVVSNTMMHDMKEDTMAGGKDNGMKKEDTMAGGKDDGMKKEDAMAGGKDNGMKKEDAMAGGKDDGMKKEDAMAGGKDDGMKKEDAMAKGKDSGMKEDAKAEAKEHGMGMKSQEHGHMTVTAVKMVSESCKK
jgi:hypothetical protein